MADLMPQTVPETAERTRDALIEAGLSLFGAKGFAAASTREIAALAGANLAAIGYHFGGKAGLRLACAEAVTRQIAALFDPGWSAQVRTPDAARRVLVRLIGVVGQFLATAPKAGDIAAFMLREIGEDGPVLAGLYHDMIEPRHRELCRLWGLAAGVPAEAEATRLAVFAMVGQVLYFRIARPLVLRRMGWDEVSPEAAARLVGLLQRNLLVSLEASAAAFQQETQR